MNTVYLQYFLAIAQHGSINKAAKALYLNYSSLVYAMNELEQEIGAPLFVRNNSGVALTESGKAVARDAQGILDTISSWSKDTTTQKEIFVNINSAPCIYHSFLDDIIYKLVFALPNLHITSNESLSFFSEQSPDKNSLYILGHTSNEINKKHYFVDKYKLQEIPLFKTKYGFYIHKHHPLAEKSIIQSTEIRDTTIFTNSHPSVTSTSFFPLFDPSKIIYLPSQPQIFEMIAKNKGCTILPMHLYSFPNLVDPEKITMLPIAGYDEYIYIYLFYFSEFAKNPVIQQAIDLIAHYPFTVIPGAEPIS